MTCNLTTYAQPECDRTRTWPPSLCSHPTWYITLPFYVSSNWRRAVCVTSICQIGAFKKKQWSFFLEETERNWIENTRSKFSSTTELERSWKGSASLSHHPWLQVMPFPILQINILYGDRNTTGQLRGGGHPGEEAALGARRPPDESSQ